MKAMPGTGSTPDRETVGIVFDMDTFAVHDGPGIRLSVYLKGCPLNCRWCHSPESQSARPELLYAAERCENCGACVDVCPNSAHTRSDIGHAFDRRRCTACGACAEVCPSGAVRIAGQTVSAGDIIDRAVRMKPFFDHSGGGITLTGGEVTQQPEFAVAILRGCRQAGIHTAIETGGACSRSRMETVARHCDLILFDVKLADAEEHMRWTGASNRPILENLRALMRFRDARGGTPAIRVRMPLIPAVTDTRANLADVFSLLGDVGLAEVGVLPYNPSAAAKYEWLGLPYTIRANPQPPESLRRIAEMGEGMGIAVRVE